MVFVDSQQPLSIPDAEQPLAIPNVREFDHHSPQPRIGGEQGISNASLPSVVLVVEHGGYDKKSRLAPGTASFSLVQWEAGPSALRLSPEFYSRRSAQVGYSRDSTR